MLRKTLKTTAIAASLMLANSAFAAGWTGTVTLKNLNFGGNGTEDVHIQVEGRSYTDCASPHVFIVERSNPNFKEFVGALMAAKIAKQQVDLRLLGCKGNFLKVVEVIL